MVSIFPENYKDFAVALYEEYEVVAQRNEYADICIVAKFKDAKHIIAELIRIGFEIADIVEFSDEFSDGYKDEYLITISNDGIWVCRAKNEYNEYVLVIGCESVFVMYDCNSKILKNISCTDLFEVEICSPCDDEYENICKDDSESDYEDDCEFDDDNECCNDDIHGFFVDKTDNNGNRTTIELYTSEAFSKEYFAELLKKINF